ncbi:hypothetical protein MKZ38_004992 [Zalerion maritima]|uniref:AAA+ ATPase domain-containing protein n=1 Tax=Zalerion maritima TaxID=339359 RepID=A0AAD5WP85_9PEZI|nr:hypothetical protein MKZ38_004992 [Zalerion maritima]
MSPPPFKSKELKVRPFPNPSQERADWRDQSTIIVSLDVLADLKLKEGGLCRIAKDSSASRSREAVVSVAREKLGKNVIQISRSFQKLCELKIGDVVRFSNPQGTSGTEVPRAEAVIVKDVTAAATVDDPDSATKNLEDEEYEPFLADLKTNFFKSAGMLVPGMMFKVPSRVSTFRKRTFSVVLVNGKEDSVARFDPFETKVKMSTNVSGEKDVGAAVRLEAPPIIGQEKSIRELNLFLSQYGQTNDVSKRGRTCGLVIEGPEGGSKHKIVKFITSLGWGTTYEIISGDTVSSIRQTLKNARENQPAIVLIKYFKTENQGFINTLADFLDTLSEDDETLGCLPRVLVLVTCTDYLSNIPAMLRTPTRFKHVVKLGIPDNKGRKAILDSIQLKFYPEEAKKCMEYLVENTFGWTEVDIISLVDAIEYNFGMDRNTMKATAMPVDHGKVNKPSGSISETEAPQQYIRFEHCLHARQQTRPSTMEGVDARPPKILWADIGGNDGLKKSLALSSPNPLVGPPRGIILYGPPGCSKTMAAQAMANSARCNFFPVKGGELLNMYVGESERNVRQLFEKARRAAPSIIFFDELDAIGGGRASMGQKRSGGGGDNSSGVKIIQALLTEIDGFEARAGIMVVGATNRPDMIDEALLRPGRIDQVFFVGPPDQKGREQILRKLVGEKKEYVTEELLEGIPGDDGFAGRMTEGFSGAEVTQAWKTCLLNVVREHKEETGELQGENEREDEEQDGPGTEEKEKRARKLIVEKADLEKAIRGMDKRITPDMLHGYEEWRRELSDF